MTENTPIKSLTIAFDEVKDTFHSIYSAIPPFYIMNRKNLLSVNPFNSKHLYIHNSGNWGDFYGSIREAYVKFVINEEAEYNKVLRFIEYNNQIYNLDGTIARNETITSFEISNDYQTTGKINYSSNRFKHRFNKWRLKIPRDINSPNQKARLRNTYFIVTFYFDNLSNKELILNKIVSYYDNQIY